MKKGRFTEEQIVGFLKRLIADMSLDWEVLKLTSEKTTRDHGPLRLLRPNMGAQGL